MKKFILAALMICSTVSAFAAEIVLLDTQIPSRAYFMTYASTRIQVDQNTSEAFVDVTVTEERPMHNPGPGWCDQWGRCHPNRMPMPMQVEIFSQRIKVEGLMLMGDRLVFQGEQADVDCGYLGVSRVFRKPTLYLNGNCKASANIVGNYRDQRVVVKFKTK